MVKMQEILQWAISSQVPNALINARNAVQRLNVGGSLHYSGLRYSLFSGESQSTKESLQESS
jgi:hypothetical protein